VILFTNVLNSNEVREAILDIEEIIRKESNFPNFSFENSDIYGAATSSISFL
jgi:hypothetical protein